MKKTLFLHVYKADNTFSIYNVKKCICTFLHLQYLLQVSHVLHLQLSSNHCKFLHNFLTFFPEPTAPCEGTNSPRLFTPGETKALAESKVH